MKRLKIIATIALASVLMVSGCGNFGKNADKPNREDAAIIHENEKAGGSLRTGAGYGFSLFDLEIDTDGNETVVADYEMKQNEKPTTDYVNKLHNVNLTGDKAMNELHKFFIDILITKDTPQQVVIDKIQKWYNIDTYTAFNLLVHFDDGTVLDIKDSK